MYYNCAPSMAIFLNDKSKAGGEYYTGSGGFTYQTASSEPSDVTTGRRTRSAAFCSWKAF